MTREAPTTDEKRLAEIEARDMSDPIFKLIHDFAWNGPMTYDRLYVFIKNQVRAAHAAGQQAHRRALSLDAGAMRNKACPHCGGDILPENDATVTFCSSYCAKAGPYNSLPAPPSDWVLVPRDEFAKLLIEVRAWFPDGSTREFIERHIERLAATPQTPAAPAEEE